QEFQDGLDLVFGIINIHSMSFGEFNYIFDKLCVRGEKLPIEEERAFLEARKITDEPKGSHKHFFDRVVRSI
ncbi:hypothetical protein ACPXBB_26595, partial [Escherichia coli]|uniref:hypothetical protein n=1 Tax=Escherichia coli TaxID=562 RepID=UPI003CE9F433